jgi:hypothetical protein
MIAAPASAASIAACAIWSDRQMRRHRRSVNRAGDSASDDYFFAFGHDHLLLQIEEPVPTMSLRARAMSPTVRAKK